MRIAIDARWIFQHISGIGAYTRELITHLLAEDSRNTYLLLFDNAAIHDRTLGETGAGNAANAETALLPYGVFSPWNQLRLGSFLRRKAVDIYHSTNYMIPLLQFPKRRRGRIACVTTIHDVIPMIFPSHAPRSRKARVYPVYRRLMVEIGARSDLVITDSLASRDDIIKHLHIPGEDTARVRHVYCGVSDRFHSGPTPAVPDPAAPATILYVGRTDPYKNVETLVRAFADARQQTSRPMKLQLVGAPDPRYPEPKRLAESLGITDAIHWTGYLDDDELAASYRAATVLVHPSRYEGFGLQVAEAMASGTPVICSRAGSLAEVAGDAAILLDEDDTAGFSSAITRVVDDPDFAAELSRKGRAQASQFTWTATARSTLALYEEVAGMQEGESPDVCVS